LKTGTQAPRAAGLNGSAIASAYFSAHSDKVSFEVTPPEGCGCRGSATDLASLTFVMASKEALGCGLPRFRASLALAFFLLMRLLTLMDFPIVN
jgi:hypothetical protein